MASEEAGCSKIHKQAVVDAGWGDTVRTLVVSGRPLRVKRNEYIAAWEEKEGMIKELTERGIVPMMNDMNNEVEVDIPFLMGQVSAVINDIKPAKQIIEDMVLDSVKMLKMGQTYLDSRRWSKL